MSGLTIAGRAQRRICISSGQESRRKAVRRLTAFVTGSVKASVVQKSVAKVRPNASNFQFWGL